MSCTNNYYDLDFSQQCECVCFLVVLRVLWFQMKLNTFFHVSWPLALLYGLPIHVPRMHVWNVSFWDSQMIWILTTALALITYAVAGKITESSRSQFPLVENEMVKLNNPMVHFQNVVIPSINQPTHPQSLSVAKITYAVHLHLSI